MAHKKYRNSKGEVVPSVTTIISNNLGWNKQFLIDWSKKIALTQGRDSNEIMEEASKIGTLTHYLVECKITNQTPDITPYRRADLLAARNGYLAFCDWEKSWKPTKYEYSEVELVSDKYNFGGTIDIIASKDNKLYILDLKTSNHIHPEMVIQLAAYKNLFEEKHEKLIDSCGIIKLQKDEQRYGFFPVSSKQIQAGWETFLSLVKVQQSRELLEGFGK